MGCGASQDADKSGQPPATSTEESSNTVQINVQSADTLPATATKKTTGPPVQLSKAQILAAKQREEEKQEEERKKNLRTIKMADGPSVRTTRATEMARDARAKEDATPSPAKAKSSGTLLPNGSISTSSANFDSELPPMESKSYTEEDFVGHTVGKMLGKGSFGASFECTLRNGDVCCVKIIEFGGVADSTEVANLRSEIKLMKRLVHPHIVQYYGCSEDASNKTIAIFMEIVTGGTLMQYLKQWPVGKAPRDLIKKWIRQILLGVKYLHDSGIVHRDIKGANILMTGDGVIRLADFGCSKSIDDTCSKTRGCSTMVGTPYWMAPEVLKSLPYGPKADIWSVGCTIVEMITGKAPWPEMGNMWAAVYKIANSSGPPPGIPKEIPKTLSRLLERCFERNPLFRASADDLLQHAYFTETS